MQELRGAKAQLKSSIMQLLPYSVLLFCQRSLLASGLEIVSDATSFTKLNPCDESFPLASQISTTGLNNSNRRHLVAVPDDPTRGSYAPLCPDGKRVDIRQLVNCNAGSCFEEVFQQCTFECTWNTPNPPTPPPTNSPSRPPTRTPTPRPSYGVTETVHAVRLKFTRVPDRYDISPELRSIILRLTTQILEQNLDERLELIDVTYASSATVFANRYLRTLDKSRSLDTVNASKIARQLPYTMFLPLRIVVKSTTEVSDFALSYIMETLRGNIDQLHDYLTSSYGEDYMNSMNPTDGQTFDFNGIEVESFDFSELTEMGDPPTPPPTSATVSRPLQTSTPTPRPTRFPSLHPSFEIKETVHDARLKFTQVPDGFRISPDLRSIILRFISEILKNHLDERLELVEVSFVSSATTFDNRNWRKLDSRSPSTKTITDRQLPYTVFFPLRIVIKSTVDVSRFSHSYVIETLRDNIDELDYYLRSSYNEDFMISSSENGDGLIFDFSGIAVESYDFNDWTDMGDPPGPTPFPSPRPDAMRESSHRVLLTIIDATKGYHINQALGEYILRIISDSLERTLDGNFVLIDVQYATVVNSFAQNDSSSGQISSEVNDNLLLPLRVRVRRPGQISDDVALQLILQAMEQSRTSIESSLKAIYGVEVQYIDGNQLLNFSFDRISFDSLNSKEWTSVSYIESEESGSSDQENGSTWWIWLIIVLLLLCILCICCAACFVHRRRRNGAEVKDSYKVEKKIKGNDSRSRSKQTASPRTKGVSQKSSKPSSKEKHQDAPPTLFDLAQDLEEANHRRQLQRLNQHSLARASKASSHMSFHTDGVTSVISVDIDPPEQRASLVHTRDSPTLVTGVDPSEYCDKIILYNPSISGEDPSECVLHRKEPLRVNEVEDGPPALRSIQSKGESDGDKTRGLRTESIHTFNQKRRSEFSSKTSSYYYGGMEPRGVKQKSFYSSNIASRAAEEPRGFKQKSVYFDSSSYYGHKKLLDLNMNPNIICVDASDLHSHYTERSFQSHGSSERQSNNELNHFIIEGTQLKQNNIISDPSSEVSSNKRSSKSQKLGKANSKIGTSGNKRHPGRRSSSDTKSNSSGNMSFATKEPSLNSRTTYIGNQE
ncbi:hypothetical protein ACHAXS_008054 [Conticribra weissflogii]